MAATLMQLPDDLRRAVEAELDEGERIMWCGQRCPSTFACRALPIALFAIPGLGFIIFWIVGALGMGGPLSFALFAPALLLIALGLLVSSPRLARRARRTAYLVTDCRALIVAAGRSTRVRSFKPEKLGDVRKRVRRDGSGDLIFEEGVRHASQGTGNPFEVDNGFYGVEDVNEAEQFVRALAARASTRGTGPEAQ